MNHQIIWFELGKGAKMQKLLHMKTTVLPGGRIEIVNPQLHAGEAVEVVVRHSNKATQPSALEIIEQAPGQRMFTTSHDVESYLKDERTSWRP